MTPGSITSPPRDTGGDFLRIAIVDDDPGVRASLEKTVGLFAGCRCVGRFASGEEALSGLPACRPDVVLMDINMPRIDGIECVQRLKADHDGMEFIMLTVYEDTESIFRALAAGASGYLLKRAGARELEAAIRQVHAGGSPMTAHIARKVVQRFRQPESAPKPQPAEADGGESEQLTPRQQEILEHLARGLLYKEIAEALGISYETVNNHIRQIYKKLHIRSRSQAVAKYFQDRSRDHG
ncbi:MAG: response regulator [Planctomycetia bacterium]